MFAEEGQERGFWPTMKETNKKCWLRNRESEEKKLIITSMTPKKMGGNISNK